MSFSYTDSEVNELCNLFFSIGRSLQNNKSFIRTLKMYFVFLLEINVTCVLDWSVFDFLNKPLQHI